MFIESSSPKKWSTSYRKSLMTWGVYLLGRFTPLVDRTSHMCSVLFPLTDPPGRARGRWRRKWYPYLSRIPEKDFLCKQQQRPMEIQNRDSFMIRWTPRVCRLEFRVQLSSIAIGVNAVLRRAAFHVFFSTRLFIYLCNVFSWACFLAVNDWSFCVILCCLQHLVFPSL